MLSELTGLFGGGEFPRIFARAPFETDAIALSFDGAGDMTVSIEDDRMLGTNSQGAPGFNFSLDGGLTLGELVAQLSGYSGFSATLADPATSEFLAIGLLAFPDTTLDAVTPTILHRFTSENWRLLQALARELEAERANLDNAPPQLNLLQSADFFADLWGLFTATVRKNGEGDPEYTARQLHELLRPRDNNFALADVIEEDTGQKVIEIRDLRPLIFLPSHTPLRGFYLPGRRYNTATFEAILDGVPTALVNFVVERDKAAGTKGFITGTFVLGDDHSGFDFAVSTLLSLGIQAMQIGVTPIGAGKIGPP